MASKKEKSCISRRRIGALAICLTSGSMMIPTGIVGVVLMK